MKLLEVLVVAEPHLRAKRPVGAPLAGPYGQPFHPILVTVPTGVSGLVSDIASQAVSNGSSRSRSSA
ncbi:hypothetical protein [Streptomyces sp. NPDC088801]|uniref:hypothetical protein n=1 Tax=Streptomyces sp. NPDC088801 TaxID=3365903 RepID=UPI00381723B1